MVAISILCARIHLWFQHRFGVSYLDSFFVMDLTGYLTTPTAHAMPVWWRSRKPNALNDVFPFLGLDPVNAADSCNTV